MRLIDADALKDFINRQLAMTANTAVVMNAKDFFENIVDNAPTIEPFSTSGYVTTSTDGPPVVYAELKHGKWMPHPTEPDWDVCSVCGTGTMRRTHGYHNGAFWDAEESYSYCPWCGARMDE